jgi:hypothetical protein
MMIKHPYDATTAAVYANNPFVAARASSPDTALESTRRKPGKQDSTLNPVR